MGFVSDAFDAAMIFLPFCTHESRYTSSVFALTFVSFVVTLPILAFAPIRLIFLLVGLTPFALSHPMTIQYLKASYTAARPWIAQQRMRLLRIIDDDKLQDQHWHAPLKEVYLWENERYSQSGSSPGWSKSTLRLGERKAWTRGRDGWSDAIVHEGAVNNLTFSLDQGWQFVETENWRIDYAGSWSDGGADDDGWVYSNDAWQDSRPMYLDEWKSKGTMTRRRRWLRRIYYTPPTSGGAIEQ